MMHKLRAMRVIAKPLLAAGVGVAVIGLGSGLAHADTPVPNVPRVPAAGGPVDVDTVPRPAVPIDHGPPSVLKGFNNFGPPYTCSVVSNVVFVGDGWGLDVGGFRQGYVRVFLDPGPQEQMIQLVQVSDTPTGHYIAKMNALSSTLREGTHQLQVRSTQDPNGVDVASCSFDYTFMG